MKAQHVSPSVWLFATPWTVAQPGSSDHGIFQARTLDWVAIPFSRASSQPKIWIWVSSIGAYLFSETLFSNKKKQLLIDPTTWSEVKSFSRVQLCDPMDYNLSGYSNHGIFQARILEWVAISFRWIWMKLQIITFCGRIQKNYIDFMIFIYLKF